MSDALVLYDGKVMHARMKPVAHRFSYAMSSILIDLDRLEAAGRQSLVFSVNKSNLLSFREKDFGPRDGSSLRAYIDGLTDQAKIERAHNIYLLCYPRVLGYGFNPISVYFCRDFSAKTTCLIYEVRNTFGEMHTYVQPVRTGQASKAGIRQEADKVFYVSPFLDMQMRYFFRVSEPDDEIALRILEKDSDGPILAATFFGRKRTAKTSSLLATMMQTMGLTWKVTAGIHFEALKLWTKGLKIRPRLAHNLSHSFPDRPQMHSSGSKRVNLQGGKFDG